MQGLKLVAIVVDFVAKGTSISIAVGSKVRLLSSSRSVELLLISKQSEY